MWFLRALKAKYVSEENGFFTSELSKAKEMILWAGSTSDHPRKIYLWLEPVITIGAVARLIDNYQWPQSQVGLQSRAPWPFDLIGYDTDRETELLACEVKKSVRECQRLLEEIKHFSAQPPLAEEPRKSVVRNAYRKVVGIRRSWPVVFWAVGPGGKDNVFEVVRAQASDVFSLEPASRKDSGFVEGPSFNIGVMKQCNRAGLTSVSSVVTCISYRRKPRLGRLHSANLATAALTALLPSRGAASTAIRGTTSAVNEAGFSALLRAPARSSSARSFPAPSCPG